MFCSKCGTQIADDALFCFKCGNKTQGDNVVDVVVQDTQALPTVNNNTKEYLTHAKTLEVNRYTLFETIRKIENKKQTLGLPKHFGYRKCAPKKDFIKPFIITVVLGAIFNIITDKDMSYFVNWLILLCISGVVGVAFWWIKDNKYIREYENQIKEDKERVLREKQQIVELSKQQEELNDQISDITDVLGNLYALNVVYPKYREMLPIITMWEYFDSGRCTDLTGADGAYNLYESESRQNIIISNLNQAVSMLAQIRDNQYALYEAIEESNVIAERLCYQNESIKHNSEITAYNSKIAADNSSVSAYIDFCKF
ncbi:MAG: zinc ribbon domain-containing protein [Clostridia bacterium]|nr:zinc ribbon domain-containing protein [Clostridia bacterium]